MISTASVIAEEDPDEFKDTSEIPLKSFDNTIHIVPQNSGNDEFQLKNRMIAKKIKEMKLKEKQLTRKQMRCKIVYYGLGLIALVLSLLSSAIMSSYETLTTGQGRVVFIFSVITSVVTSAVNFLGIESKISTYDQLRKLYHKFVLEIQDETFGCETVDEVEKIMHSILRRQIKMEGEFVALSDNVCCCDP